MSDLLLPGPGWIRECSPGVLLRRPSVASHLVGHTVRVGWIIGDSANVLVQSLGVAGIVPLDAIALDLSHEVGRHHACTGLAMKAHGIPEKDACRAYWARSRYGGHSGAIWSLNFPSPSTDYPGTECTNNVRLYAAVAGFFQKDALDCLAALNLGDPTLMSDGSRRLDALALQAVCLHTETT